MGKVITTAVAAVAGLIFIIMAAATAAVPRIGGGGIPLMCAVPSGGMPAGLSEEQWRNAATIVHTGQRMSIPAYGWAVAVATALQESNLVNLGHLGERNDHDSLGLFQQRPSMGWGTPEQLTDPEYASKKFYEKLITIAGWQDLPLTVAAQRVQISAYPNAYAKHEERARAIVDALRGSCVPLSASGWVAPVRARVTSGFQTPERPGHNGVDLGAARFTPIRAVANGTVVTVTCNVGGRNYGLDVRPSPCDVDGSPSIGGCGWFVDVVHVIAPSNMEVTSRYCHMAKAPFVRTGATVQAGEVIGLVGSSGNSSGPHLHFEIRLGDDGRPVDAVPFMASMGAPLGLG